MDKCILKKGDLSRLFEWRDNNKELVRRIPMPVKGIEIMVEDEDVKMKCVRNDNKVEIRIYSSNDEKALIVVEILPFNRGYIVKRTKPPELIEGAITEACSIYSSLMALITYGDGIEYTDTELEVLDSAVKLNNRSIQKFKSTQHRQSITYLLHRDSSGRVSVGAKGKHSSPKGEFRVRGHFRHYQDGKVVWISEFKKGTGKRKNKVYRL